MRELTSVAAEAAAASMWPLSEEELLTFIDRVHTAQQMLHAAMLHAVREVEGRAIPAKHQATSPQVWLRGRLRIGIGSALRMLAQARLLDTVPELDAAVTAGRINAEQLDSIVKAVGDLPSDLEPDVRNKATTTLMSWTSHLDPIELRKAGKRIQMHVAPDLDDAAEEERLRRAERAAYEQRFLTLSPIGDGRVRVRGILDARAAATVTAAIDPLCRPGTAPPIADRGGPNAERADATGIDGGEDLRTPGQRRADALVDVSRLLLAGGLLPDNGGDRPQLVITASYDVLRQRLGGGTTDTGEPVSAAAVRQMACDARILPLVFGGDSQILDAGRSRRLVTGPLRRALNARDRGCTFPGCDRPAGWCDAHHIVPWTDGGTTDLTNVALLCEHHHRAVHDVNGWQVRIGADGHPEFMPPAWIDPEQVPRRNPYHRRT
ncbi:HNH endonuclease signature motif containing protein [Actinoplanes aureus]|uniref:HNH endonuclease signature motif containing protein n=1 Tax=Actinoplanes aureus TaxID=2792083 RepID=UPI001E600A64|nr:HNH endonuclease signature motif containing protein [Actinoplanes aureus]